MQLATTLAMVLSIAATSYASIAKVINNCTVDVDITSVDSSAGPTSTIPGNGSYWTEDLHFDPKTGVAIKISVPSSAPAEFDLAYTLNQTEGSIYYDLNAVNGFPAFGGSKFILAPSRQGCPVFIWEGPNKPAGTGTLACFGDTDLVLTLCA